MPLPRSTPEAQGISSQAVRDFVEAADRINTLHSFMIVRHGKVIGVYLSRDRIEALIETMELLGDPAFMDALKEFKTGKMKFVDMENVRW